MLKKFLSALGGFAVVALTLGAVKVAQIKKASGVSHVPPPSAVTTLEARSVDWHSYLKAIGTLAPVQGATLSADADGIIARIVADSGSAVKAGDLLVELDATTEIAQANAAQARADLAQINLDRSKELWGRQAIAKSDYDAAEATAKQTVADVAALRPRSPRSRCARRSTAGWASASSTKASSWLAAGRCSRSRSSTRFTSTSAFRSAS